MLGEDLPVLRSSDTMKEAIPMIASRRGIAVACDAERRVEGLLTAGDLSRLMQRGGDVLPTPVHAVMTRQPKVAHVGELASAVAYRMERIESLLGYPLDGSAGRRLSTALLIKRLQDV